MNVEHFATKLAHERPLQRLSALEDFEITIEPKATH